MILEINVIFSDRSTTLKSCFLFLQNIKSITSKFISYPFILYYEQEKQKVQKMATARYYNDIFLIV